MRHPIAILVFIAALICSLMLTYRSNDVLSQKLFTALSVVFGLLAIASFSKQALTDDNQHS
jgi:succinate-acetate transporter protein